MPKIYQPYSLSVQTLVRILFAYSSSRANALEVYQMLLPGSAYSLILSPAVFNGASDRFEDLAIIAIPASMNELGVTVSQLSRMWMTLLNFNPELRGVVNALALRQLIVSENAGQELCSDDVRHWLSLLLAANTAPEVLAEIARELVLTSNVPLTGGYLAQQFMRVDDLQRFIEAIPNDGRVSDRAIIVYKLLVDNVAAYPGVVDAFISKMQGILNSSEGIQSLSLWVDVIVDCVKAVFSQEGLHGSHELIENIKNLLSVMSVKLFDRYTLQPSDHGVNLLCDIEKQVTSLVVFFMEQLYSLRVNGQEGLAEWRHMVDAWIGELLEQLPVRASTRKINFFFRIARSLAQCDGVKIGFLESIIGLIGRNTGDLSLEVLQFVHDNMPDEFNDSLDLWFNVFDSSSETDFTGIDVYKILQLFKQYYQGANICKLSLFNSRVKQSLMSGLIADSLGFEQVDKMYAMLFATYAMYESMLPENSYHHIDHPRFIIEPSIGYRLNKAPANVALSKHARAIFKHWHDIPPKGGGKLVFS